MAGFQGSLAANKQAGSERSSAIPGSLRSGNHQIESHQSSIHTSQRSTTIHQQGGLQGSSGVNQQLGSLQHAGSSQSSSATHQQAGSERSSGAHMRLSGSHGQSDSLRSSSINQLCASHKLTVSQQSDTHLQLGSQGSTAILQQMDSQATHHVIRPGSPLIDATQQQSAVFLGKLCIC